ncbi:MAG: GNAT family N-acetyltransferase [Candidatus Dormibacteria bacterium]
MENSLIPDSDVVLKDGSVLRLREQQPDDVELVLEFLHTLSPRSLAFRFLAAGVALPEAAQMLGRVDGRNSVGLVAIQGQPPRVVGHGIFIRTAGVRAEAAFTVADSLQGKGIGSLLLGQLAQVACSMGVEVFEAAVQPENAAMLDVFAHSGFAIHTYSQPGLVRLEFPTELTPEAMHRFEEREEQASASAVRMLLNPKSVAVIGAGRQRRTIGGTIFHNLLEGEFQGPVYPVHPEAEFIQSVRSYRHVTDIEGPVDLAVVTVPVSAVIAVARECAAKEVRSLVVISAGFAEESERGRGLQDELLEICSSSGMRIVGPNCMGIINTSPEVGLNATFAPVPPDRGQIGFLSQSGALGLAVIDATRRLGLGLSAFISVGNKADISGNDLLSFWDGDPRTEVIALYLESFGNARKFAQIAERVSRTKPIVVVKSAIGVAAQRAAASHTAALVSASDAAVDALFEKTGALRAHSLGEMFDLMALLSTQPLPQGNRVAIITNAGGPGILCADACESNGLQVAELAAATQTQLAARLSSPHASVRNPIDMIASASAEDYGAVIDMVAADENVDAIVVIFIPPMLTRAEDVAQALADAVARFKQPIPIIGVFMANSGITGHVKSDHVSIPTFLLPENAVRALAGTCRLAEWRKRPRSEPAVPAGVDPVAVATTVAHCLLEKRAWLDSAETDSIMRAYGIPVLRSAEVETPEQAAQASLDLGAKVVLKGVGPGILHKSELGAVVVGLEAGPEVELAARQMQARLAGTATPVTRFLLQEQAPTGVEVLVGATNDPAYGTVVVVAAGGTAVELVRDMTVRLAPIGPGEAEEMLRKLSTFPLLDGFRGAAKVDLKALCDVIVRLAAMAEAHSAIAEIEANPVIAGASGSRAVDVRVRVTQAQLPALVGAKRVR